jgi:hypothetical protein
MSFGMLGGGKMGPGLTEILAELGTLAVENAASIGVDLVPSGTKSIGSAANPWHAGFYNNTLFSQYSSSLTGTGRLEMIRVGTGTPNAHCLAWTRNTQRFGFYTDISQSVRADFEALDLIAIGKAVINPDAALGDASFPLFTAGQDTAAALLGSPVGGFWNHTLARLLLSLNNGSGATCDLGVADLYADDIKASGTANAKIKIVSSNDPAVSDSGSVLTGGSINLPNPSNTGCFFWIDADSDAQTVSTPAGIIDNYNGSGGGAGTIYSTTANAYLFLYANGTDWRVLYTSGNWDLV